MAGKEIRTVMAPLTDGYLLLPNSVVAEIVDMKPLESFRKRPSWLIGELDWHGWQVPVISYEHLIRKKGGQPMHHKARIMVIKTLGDSTQVNYLGFLIQGLPKLTKVTPASLVELETEDLPDVQFSDVTVEGQQAMIPDIGKLTRTVEQAAYEN
jgi:chemosensory pili system protein ChpC